MPRDLTAAMQTAVTADSGQEIVYFLSLDFSGGTIYICTAAQNILWNAITWEAVGGALKVGNIEESKDSSGQGVDLELSGVDQTILAALLSNDYRGRVCQIYYAHLSPTTGAVVDAPQLMLEGLQLSSFEVTEQRDSRTGGTVTIKTRIKGRMGIDRRKGIQSSLVSHQHYYPGDTFFQNALALMNQRLAWGTGTVYTGGGGGGGGPGDPGGGGHQS